MGEDERGPEPLSGAQYGDTQAPIDADCSPATRRSIQPAGFAGCGRMCKVGVRGVRDVLGCVRTMCKDGEWFDKSEILESDPRFRASCFLLDLIITLPIPCFTLPFTITALVGRRTNHYVMEAHSGNVQ